MTIKVWHSVNGIWQYNSYLLRYKRKSCLTHTTKYSFKIFQNGDLCISILHPPVDDPQSGELPCERWNPTQSVRTVLLSVISLLNEPNTFSPANVDASVMYRRWRDSKGKDKEYENIIRWGAAPLAQCSSKTISIRTLMLNILISKSVLTSELSVLSRSDNKYGLVLKI